jgi:hypothetical protein
MRNAKHGYLIVWKPEVRLKHYNPSLVSVEHANEIENEVKEMRRAFAAFPPENYRGTGRYPLEAAPAWFVEVMKQDEGMDIQGNKEARGRFDEILDKSEDDYDNCLIECLADAREIFGLLECPQQWEIIEVRRDDFAVGPTTLGFDVGSWSGAYSILADTIVTPEWHPPPPEDYAEVARQLSSLNQHLLFPRPEDAARFRTYYRSKSWAEGQGREDPFCIIQVDHVAEDRSD